MIGPHINTIIELTKAPIKSDTNARAEIIAAAPIVAKSTPNQYTVALLD